MIDFMVGTFRRQDPQSHPGQAPSLRQVLEAAEARLAFDLEHQPGVRAGMMDVIGRVHMNLADFEKARPNLEAALMLREVHGSDVERAESLHNLAALDRHQGRLQDAEARMRRALALQQGAPDDVDSDLARGLANLGSLLIEKGQPAEAVPFIEGALAIQERIFGESHAETARSFNTLATALSRLRRPDEAEIYYRRSVEIRRALGSARRPQLAASLSNLAVLLTHRGAFGEAEQLQREALAIRRDIYDDGHPRLASGLNGLALTLIRAHRSTEALSLVREAIEILESSGAPAWRAAIVRKNHALALAASGDCRAASVEAAEVQETLERAGRQVAARSGHTSELQ
ncbi:MAG: tetratricopeptide repeat protein, partial [Acidobacteriota bacterium]